MKIYNLLSDKTNSQLSKYIFNNVFIDLDNKSSITHFSNSAINKTLISNNDKHINNVHSLRFSKSLLNNVSIEKTMINHINFGKSTLDNTDLHKLCSSRVEFFGNNNKIVNIDECDISTISIIDNTGNINISNCLIKLLYINSIFNMTSIEKYTINNSTIATIIIDSPYTIFNNNTQINKINNDNPKLIFVNNTMVNNIDINGWYYKKINWNY